MGCLEATPTYPEVEPPEGFDIESCADIAGPGAADAGAFSALRCGECCLEQDLRDSSFILDDHCVCANLPPLQDDPYTCLAAESPGDCLQCCSDEGFGYAEGADANTHCVCWGPEDPDSCADVFDYRDPGRACAACCVEQGFLGVELDLSQDTARCVCTR